MAPDHAPWKIYRVIAGGHHGGIHAVAFDPSNHWFCTGAADQTVKIWDTSSGSLKLTLTGHAAAVRAVAVSRRRPNHLFSAGDDREIKCWDLERNAVIRSYLAGGGGVCSLAIHPTLDLAVSGGRDSVARVWDVRTRAEVFSLSGHRAAVCSLLARAADPQVITGSNDSTIRLWDLAAGKTVATLTHHKKSVRSMAVHPTERSTAAAAFVTAAADGIKKFKLPKGEILQNLLMRPGTILNSVAVNRRGVLAAAGDDGILRFLDWRSGNCFQQEMVAVHPGSLEGEACICAVCFDETGSRLVTCGADKTIKMWKEH
uniref:Uncharacterized protein n=1 Tax=Leersia perrieri TaxID=77586 RepID=A0A0D9XFP8_9ORYZ